MNWDWEKLQQKNRRRSTGGSGDAGGGGGNRDQGPNFGDINFDNFKGFKAPIWKLVPIVVLLAWLASGIYIVDPDEIGVVKRFGAYNRVTEPGPHYALPYPIEAVLTPKVTQVRRVEVGLRTIGRTNEFVPGQFRLVPEESLMLTGDENIVDVQFIVQYIINDPVKYLFRVANQDQTVKNAAEAAMREVVGYNKIDSVLTTDKSIIQAETRELMQDILDRYQSGVRVIAANLQDVHPPKEVIDAFKDVASAREDRARFINEADAYRNDILPKARGEAAAKVNEAKAYKDSTVRRAQGEAEKFLAVLAEYEKAEGVTRTRLYLETMESLLSNPELEKVFITDEVVKQAVPYLPLDTLTGSNRQTNRASE